MSGKLISDTTDMRPANTANTKVLQDSTSGTCAEIATDNQEKVLDTISSPITMNNTQDVLFPKPVSITQETHGSCSDMEVDSRDATPVAEAIHDGFQRSPPSSCEFTHGAKLPLCSPDDSGSNSAKPRLTLSAFRRPEQTVRLTRSDPGRKLETYFDLHADGCRVLGHGAFSTVRLAIRKSDGAKVAVKSIAKHEALRSRRLRRNGASSSSRQYMEEWEILRIMHNHPNIIALLDVFETDEEIQLVMEYCSGGELFNVIQKKRNRAQAKKRGQYSEYEAATITFQILRALTDLHAKGIVHRDIKLENILVASGRVDDCNEAIPVHVKLCDFGTARSLMISQVGSAGSGSTSGNSSPLTPPSRSRAYSMLGSNYYVAPEVVYGRSYDTAVDVYSLGVTLYILLCGFPPVFSDTSDSQVVFPNSYWTCISNEAQSLVQKMMNPDPLTRISAREAMQDPWIRSLVNRSVAAGSCAMKAAARRKRVSVVSKGTTRLNETDLQRKLKLDLVRSQLYQSIGPSGDGISSVAKKRSFCLSSNATFLGSSNASASPSKKRCRYERRTPATALLALADLYRGVAVNNGSSNPRPKAPESRIAASAAAAAAAAAAAVAVVQQHDRKLALKTSALGCHSAEKEEMRDAPASLAGSSVAAAFLSF